MRCSAPVVILVAVGLVASACGGGEETLTKAEFIEQANAICVEGNAQADALVDEVVAGLPDEPTPQQFAELVVELGTRFTPIAEAQLAKLRALAAPKEDRDTLAALFDDIEAAFRGQNQLAEAAAAGDQAAMDRLISGEDDLMADVDRRAVQFGIAECGA